MKKYIIRNIFITVCLLIALLMFASAFSGCGRGGSGGAMVMKDAEVAQAATMAATIPQTMHVAYNGSAGADGYADTGDYAENEVQADGSAPNVPADDDDGRKLIKNVSCRLSVKDVQAAYGNLMDIVGNLGGYEYNKSESLMNGSKYISVTIKLPPQYLQLFEYQLRSSVGDNSIVYYEMNSDDISGSYYDIASRLESMRMSLRQYQALIAKAVTIKDMLEIQREITNLQADIDSLQGQINAWDKLVRHATINVTIVTADDPLAQKKNEQWSFNSPSEILNAMGNGFIATGNVVYRIIVGLIVVIISLIPALIPIVIILFLVLYFRRRYINKKNAPNVTAYTHVIAPIGTPSGDTPVTPSAGIPSGDTPASMSSGEMVEPDDSSLATPDADEK